jgi:hypothetical protein
MHFLYEAYENYLENKNSKYYFCLMKLMVSISFILFLNQICLGSEPIDSTKTESDTTIISFEKLDELEGLCLGTKYKWGGESLAGFDCSGFVKYVYKKLGYDLPHSSRAIAKMGETIPLNEAKKGDLIIFTGYKDRNNVGHLGIVIDNEPDCLIFTHSSSAPKNMAVVRTNYYQSNYPKRFIKIIRLK